MVKRLFVGGLPYSFTKENLKEMFSKAGSVISSSIIADKKSGQSRGFGFVEMETEEGAKHAIEMFHDKEMEGRKIGVLEAKPMESKKDR